MQKTIWVVDDNEMNLKMADFILRKDYRVILMDSGVECARTIKRDRPDLILLDVQMPLMNGIRTLENIRSQKHHQDVPVIFLTAAADAATVADAGRLHAVDYVVKPFDPEELLRRVAKALEAAEEKEK